MILKKLSYSRVKTATEFFAEIHPSSGDVYTNEQLLWIIITSQSLLTVINKDMDDAIESLA
ncbi:hypothetical protein I4U23_005024 [Adineta vaga]|nr:hypothetical protein I4U23_005024 [Adineta vaga]